MSLPKILIVDDEAQIRASLKDFLSSRIQVDVIEVGNGYEALEKLKTGDVNLILLDIKMPGISGIEVMEKLRASGSKVPIIVLSKFEGEEMDNKIKSLGAEYINKPFSLKVVFSKVIEKLK